jgi:tRNA-(ms[2]io[6]A)-hydroxylase
MADSKRRLLVLKSPEPNEDDERPPWHWVGFGTIAIFAAWLPLAYLASAAETRVVSRFAEASSPEGIAESIQRASPHDVARLRFAILLLLAVPLAIGAFGGGFIVGRWSRRAGPREAALAGLVTALVTCALSWLEAGLSWAPLWGALPLVLMAGLGGWSGSRARARSAGATA